MFTKPLMAIALVSILGTSAMAEPTPQPQIPWFQTQMTTKDARPADTGLNESVSSSETSPVVISNTLDFKMNNNLQVGECLSFVNVSKKLITSVRFHFSGENSFHETVLNKNGDRDGAFSAGVNIDGPSSVDQFNVGVNGGSLGGANQKIRNCWVFFIDNQFPQSVTVTVNRVMFADGTQWRE